MVLIQGAGKGASLEQVAALPHPEVDASSVKPMGLADRSASVNAVDAEQGEQRLAVPE
jgi:hypothetical protein